MNWDAAALRRWLSQGQKGPDPESERMMRDDPDGAFALSDRLSIEEKERVIFNAWKSLVGDFAKLKKPWGTKENPSKTCADLHAAFPDLGSGHYYIDPNEGHSSDAILAFCNMESGETCIYPTPMEVEKAAYFTASEEADYEWFSEMEEGFQFSYKTEPGQLILLQHLSSTASQNITFYCENTVAYYDASAADYAKALKLMSANDVELVAGGYPRFTYTAVEDGCRNGGSGSTLIEYRTDKPTRLPFTDIAPFHQPQLTQRFGLHIGPVCFA